MILGALTQINLMKMKIECNQQLTDVVVFCFETVLITIWHKVYYIWIATWQLARCLLRNTKTEMLDFLWETYFHSLSLNLWWIVLCFIHSHFIWFNFFLIKFNWWLSHWQPELYTSPYCERMNEWINIFVLTYVLWVNTENVVVLKYHLFSTLNGNLIVH